jgi:hypothetical protein
MNRQEGIEKLLDIFEHAPEAVRAFILEETLLRVPDMDLVTLAGEVEKELRDEAEPFDCGRMRQARP